MKTLQRPVARVGNVIVAPSGPSVRHHRSNKRETTWPIRFLLHIHICIYIYHRGLYYYLTRPSSELLHFLLGSG